MSHLANRGLVRTAAAGPDSVPGDDLHHAIEREFLGLWIGIARLREQVRRAMDQSRRMVAKPPKRPGGRKPRGSTP